jgi:pyruvate,water dikinase
MASPAICWLDQPACAHRALVGGKAAYLSRLAGAFPVPAGFCLTSAAFEWAMASGMAAETAQPAGLLPDALFEELARAYATMAERCGAAEPQVAVRSSALDEDGASSSFAGQHATYLNVVGAEAIADAVVRCWASARSARALAYRLQHGLGTDSIRMAVLIQQFVIADSSAVLFSANPVNGNRDELVINASWGLGECVVGGTVTPDTYVLRAADLSIISQQIAEKRRMTVAVAGGTREVDVPRFLRSQSTFTADQVAEVGHLGRRLETVVGGPVDVECAYQTGRLYLLQCRPITALPGLPSA